MSFGTSFSLSTDQATDVDTNLVVFDLLYADAGKSVYSVAGLTLPHECILTIQHDVEKDGTKRHVVRIDETLADSLGVVKTGSVYEVIRHPISDAFTISIMKSIQNRLTDLLIEGGTGANVTKLLNNEL